MPAVLDRLYSERNDLLSLIDTTTDAAERDERDLSDTELALVARHQARIADEIDPQIEQLETIEATRSAHQRAAARTGEPPVPARLGDGPVADAEQIVYRTYAQYARDELVRRYDVLAQRVGPEARDAAMARLTRAVANTITSDIPGLLPPQHLAQIMQVIDRSRPIVESSRRVALTSGKLTYPWVTQRPQVGKQTAEKTEAPSRKMTVAMVDVIADTYVGAGDISWQAINWSTPDALALWFDLAAEEYARQTEAAAGLVLAATTGGPVTVASDDLAGWLAAITAAAGDVYATTGQRANTIYTDIATGYKLIGQVSQASPVFLPAGGFSLASGSGNVAGLTLVISPGLPADTAIVGASSALLCAETGGAPVELRAVEPALGGMEVGVIGAFVAKLVDPDAMVALTAPPVIP